MSKEFTLGSMVLLPNGRKAKVTFESTTDGGFLRWHVTHEDGMSVIYCCGEPATSESVLVSGLEEIKNNQPFMPHYNWSIEWMRIVQRPGEESEIREAFGVMGLEYIAPSP